MKKKENTSFDRRSKQINKFRMVLLLYKEKLDEVGSSPFKGEARWGLSINCNLTHPLLVKERGN